MAKRSLLILAVVLCGISTTSHASLSLIGTIGWAGMSGPPMNLIYDDSGRRSSSGSIHGGLIWLDRSYGSSEIQFDASLGTGENARLFAEAMTQQSDDWIINIRPGYTIDSWDGDWRLPHSGTNPTGNPSDSELLHLVVEELGNDLGSPFYERGIFERILVQSPDTNGGGFFGYWLAQDNEHASGTGIWFNTLSGQQETVPAGFHGGYALFVRSASVSFDPAAVGAAAEPVTSLEGFIASAGSSWDLDALREPSYYTPIANWALVEVVGMGIAGSDDRVYAWYNDGTVSAGTSSDLDFYRMPYSYSLPEGKTPADIVGMGIAGSDDHVYAWYSDGTVSAGTSSDLDFYRMPYSYSLPEGKTPVDIVGMGITGSDDRVYAWYSDGTVSSGTSWDLDFYREIYSYSLVPGKTPADVVGIGIAGSNDSVYVWYRLSIT